MPKDKNVLFLSIVFRTQFYLNLLLIFIDSIDDWSNGNQFTVLLLVLRVNWKVSKTNEIKHTFININLQLMSADLTRIAYDRSINFVKFTQLYGNLLKRMLWNFPLDEAITVMMIIIQACVPKTLPTGSCNHLTINFVSPLSLSLSVELEDIRNRINANETNQKLYCIWSAIRYIH